MTIKRTGLLLFSSLLLIFTVGLYLKRAILLGAQYGYFDFFKFYQSLLFHFSGQNIYSSINIDIVTSTGLMRETSSANLATPFFLLLLWPLHTLNYANAYVMWTGFLMTCFLLGVKFMLTAFPRLRKNSVPIMALCLIYPPSGHGLVLGQATALLFIIVVLIWLCARQQKEISAGVLMGFACAIKLFFGLFLIYFLCLKRVRLVIISLIAFLAAIGMGVMVFGIQSSFSYLTNLNTIGWYSASWNFSFYGFFTRVFTTLNGNVPLVYSPYFAGFLAELCSVMLITYLILWWRKWGSLYFDRGFSLVIVAMLLLSPLGWLYYFPLLLIPYVILISEGNDKVHGAACFLLVLSTQIGPQIIVKKTSQLFLTGGVGLYILLGLVFLLSQFSPKDKKLSEQCWWVIYALVFVPSFLSLITVYRCYQ